MLTSSLTRSTLTRSMVNGRRSQGAHWSVSGSHRQVGPACQCRGKKRKRKRASSGRMSSWASPPPWPSGPNSARPLLLLLFLFLLSPLRLTTPAHLSATPGSRAASSRSSANSSPCVRVCVLCVQSRLATPRTRRRGVGTVTAHRRRDGDSATRLRFDVQASETLPWLGRECA